MAWPAYSPDLNPIENLWDALGHALSSCFPPPATHIELVTALQEWRLLNSAVVDHLIESMVRSDKGTNPIVPWIINPLPPACTAGCIQSERRASCCS
ncbi:transposable element Tcb1 transposase [Trichonephila clavipes]|nr:transposable element Tcb1 transposase [Trichonephila clavipes]